MVKEVIYNQEQLNERLAYWQEKLRLRDWMVEISIVRERDMHNDEANAEIYRNTANKTAYINIADPIDFDDRRPEDMEWLLVHELLHLHFAPWNNDEIAVEQRIDHA